MKTTKIKSMKKKCNLLSNKRIRICRFDERNNKTGKYYKERTYS